ncbi:MAG: serine protease [Puniceicoccaceae bacterium]|nr:MAG: serine protease [Puniceicoccaceae bacterium]
MPSSHQKPRIGQPVLTITSPLDFAPTPAFGLVSGFESYFADFVFPFTYTRIGIPMGPAEGGSPVIDLEGNLVGITVASVPEVRSSYVVPSRALEKMVADFSTRGAIRYGTLPLELTERPDQDRLARVVVVDGVASGSAAASAGIRVGDKVRTMGGKQIRTIDDVRDAIFYARVGQFLLLEVDRGGNRLEFALMVEEDTSKPDPAPLPTPPGTEPTLPPQTEESEPLPTIP